jgi:hypothetical protein
VVRGAHDRSQATGLAFEELAFKVNERKDEKKIR